MAWKVYGTPYTTGQLNDTSVYQTIKFHQNLMVKALRVWVIAVGAPPLTGLKMKIYANDQATSTPSELIISSSNSWDMDEILTSEVNGVKEIYFEFVPFMVQSDTTYHLVMNADTYSPTGNNEFAWRNVWPDPVYSTNYTVTGNNYLNSPKFVSAVIGSVL